MVFGAGVRYCIGAPLVRLVASVALQMLLAEFPNLAFDGIPQWPTVPTCSRSRTCRCGSNRAARRHRFRRGGRLLDQMERRRHPVRRE